jgi:hypothetical protein
MLMLQSVLTVGLASGVFDGLWLEVEIEWLKECFAQAIRLDFVAVCGSQSGRIWIDVVTNVYY